jgi:superkiller protein 3
MICKQALERYEEALQTCEQALRLKAGLAVAYKNKAYALYGMKRYGESLQACEQTIDLKSNLTAAYALMGMALFQLERYEEASTAFSLWSEYLLL